MSAILSMNESSASSENGDGASSFLSNASYEFTNDWFDAHIEIWDAILCQIRPEKILEIGSFEGKSSCFFIEHLGRTSDIRLHCIDTWQGSIEHQRGQTDEYDMQEVERRFQHNITLAKSLVKHSIDIHIHRCDSRVALPRLLADNYASFFDIVYVDGSHQAPDVLSDSVFAFHLLRRGGMIIFDDYLWCMEGKGNEDSLNMPKPAIDAFVNLFQRKLRIIPAPLGQFFVVKTAD